MNVFITGGAGYIGTVLTNLLLTKGYNVTIYDLFIYGDHIPDHTNLKKINGDIRDIKKLDECMKNQDIVIHLASISNDPSYELNPNLSKSIDYDCFQSILDICKKNLISKFIFASSASVYGIQSSPAYETTKCKPLTDYSKYKLECEKLLELSDLDYVILRCATVCGYSDRLRLDLVVNILTSHALINKHIKVFGGEQIRPNININDMTRAYLWAIESNIHRVTYNIGYNNMRVQDIAYLVKDKVKYTSIVDTVSDDKRSYHMNSDKIRDDGFKFKYTVGDAIQSLIDEYNEGNILDGIKNPMYHNVKRMKQINLI